DDVPASDEQAGDEQAEADEVALKAPAEATEEMATYEDDEKDVAEQDSTEQEPTDTEAQAPSARDRERDDDQLRARPTRTPGEWYVVHTYSGYERRVKANLETRSQTLEVEDDIYEIEVPMEEVVEFKNTVRKVINRVRVPG